MSVCSQGYRTHVSSQTPNRDHLLYSTSAAAVLAYPRPPNLTIILPPAPPISPSRLLLPLISKSSSFQFTHVTLVDQYNVTCTDIAIDNSVLPIMKSRLSPIYHSDLNGPVLTLSVIAKCIELLPYINGSANSRVYRPSLLVNVLASTNEREHRAP